MTDVKMFSSMESAKHVRILDKAAYVNLSTNAIRRRLNISNTWSPSARNESTGNDRVTTRTLMEKRKQLRADMRLTDPINILGE